MAAGKDSKLMRDWFELLLSFYLIPYKEV